MKTFNLSKDYAVVCEWKKTRMAFKHEATVMQNGCEVYKTKICYQNRTWESYDFQSVLHKVIRGYFKGEDVQKFMDKVDGKGAEDVKSSLGMIGAVAMLGEILCDKPEDKNSWKMRMLKAGMGEGFQPPDDWDQLPEAEKQRRLDGAINTLKA